jgi:hypothetical protein
MRNFGSTGGETGDALTRAECSGAVAPGSEPGLAFVRTRTYDLQVGKGGIDVRSTLSARIVLGMLLLAGVAGIHFALAPHELEEQTYIGVLFILAGVGAALAAVGIWRSSAYGAWTLGALVCACTFVGFILSRTTGLPGGYEEDEWSTLGVLSLALEGTFVVLYAVTVAFAPRRRTATLVR